MFYDVNGNEMSAGYSVSGEMLTRGYDVNGNPIDAVVAPFTIDNVVSYYQQPTLDMVDEINALSDDILPFVVLTDTHTQNNTKHSQAIATYLVKNSKANRLFYLGDISWNLWVQDEYTTFFEPLKTYLANQTYVTIGNHEFFGNSSYDNLQVIYTDFLARKGNLNGNPQHFYYYFDDPVYKVRFIFINTADGGSNAVTSAQKTWLNSALSSITSGWKVVLFGHHDIMPNDPITGKWISSSASYLSNLIGSCAVPVIGYFCGHEHLDRVVKINNKFYQVTLLNDCATKGTDTSIVNPDRTRGTVAEQAVSIVCANLTTGAVEIKRIGAKNPDIDLSYNFNN